MGNVGKQKKHQYGQMQYKLNKIASLIENTSINSKQDAAFINGLERALSLIEDRQPVYKSYVKKSWIERIKGLKGSMNIVRMVRENRE